MALHTWRSNLADYQKAVREAKAQYLSRIISASSNRPRVLFSSINSVINPSSTAPTDISTTTSEKFLLHFIDKVKSVRQNIVVSSGISNADVDLSSPSEHAAVLDSFEPVSFSFFSRVVQQMKPRNCPLDVVPAKVLKEVFCSVGPCLLTFINSCLGCGSVPAAFKHAVVRPLLRKPNLDPSVLSKFRPVSHLPFLSNVLEEVVFIQLQHFRHHLKVSVRFSVLP